MPPAPQRGLPARLKLGQTAFGGLLVGVGVGFSFALYRWVDDGEFFSWSVATPYSPLVAVLIGGASAAVLGLWVVQYSGKFNYRHTGRVLISVSLIWVGFGAGLFGPAALGVPGSWETGNFHDRPDETTAFDALSDGYHSGLTAFGDVKILEARNIDAKQLAHQLGAPEQCSVEGSPPRRTSSKKLQQGELIWFSGVTECQEFSLPWDAIVGVPSRRSPKGVLILLHGTASSPEALFGVETGSYFPDYSNRAGLKGLADGFVVIAPRILTDLVDDEESGYNYLRNRIDRRAQALGLRLIGMEQVTLTHLLNSVNTKLGLQDLKQVIYGVSLGGLVAFYQAALNPEIDAVIVSQWSEDRFEKLVGATHQSAMWLYEDGDYSITLGAALELRDREVAKLIFPRPLGIEVGEKDPRSLTMLPLLGALSELYVNYPQRLQITVNDGGHEMKYSPAVDKMWSEVG